MYFKELEPEIGIVFLSLLTLDFEINKSFSCFRIKVLWNDENV